MAKIDLDSIVKNVKQIINPTGQTPSAQPDDALGIKLAQLSTSIQLVASLQAQQTKEFAKINALANQIFEAVEVLRHGTVSDDETVSKPSGQSPDAKGE